MQPLQQTATTALRQALAGQPTTAAKISCVFRIAAGPALGRAAEITWTEDGTLRVTARDTRWRSELRRAKPVVLERIGLMLGPGVVRRLVIEK